MEELETQPEGAREPESQPESQPEAAPAQPQTISIEEWMAASEPLADDAPAPAALEDVQLLAVLEACVYVAEEPLLPAQIAAALNQDPERIRALMRQLMAEFERPEHGVSIREVAGGYKMATKPEHHEAVRSFVKSLKAPLKLSLPALETLAVVAYKQPVTSPEIQDIRGVQGTGVLKTLLERKLITEAGRKNVIGKPILYKTTKEFLIQFGLKDLAELPTLKEFEEIRRMAMPEGEAVPEAGAAAAESVAAGVEAEVPAALTEDGAPAADADDAASTADVAPAESEGEAPAADADDAASTADAAPAESEAEASNAQAAHEQTEAQASAPNADDAARSAHAEASSPNVDHDDPPEVDAHASAPPPDDAAPSAQAEPEAEAAPPHSDTAPPAPDAPPAESQES
ncbi:MAG TPA: SMC-Scp complex subunit ScpB [Bryobacteraceae bacterium]|jgi:segregation and condensation protein B|nr:SMC-Scp complex subunit ScpB [Bryobacteraceae bacterium]